VQRSLASAGNYTCVQQREQLGTRSPQEASNLSWKRADPPEAAHRARNPDTNTVTLYAIVPIHLQAV